MTDTNELFSLRVEQSWIVILLFDISLSKLRRGAGGWGRGVNIGRADTHIECQMKWNVNIFCYN